MNFGALFRRRRFEAEMDAELRFHMESYANDLMKSGVPEEEAIRRARVEFGNVELKKEDCRASFGLRLWDELRADLTYGWRMLRHSPAFTAVAVISLALGIGANTAVFTLANEFLYRKMAVPHPEQLRMLDFVRTPKTKIGGDWGNSHQNGNGQWLGSTFPFPLYADLRKHQSFLEDLIAFKDLSRVTVNAGGEAERVSAQMVSGNFYHALGISTIAGRPIVESDDSESAAPVAVISDAYWFRRFGRSADALGKAIRVNSVPVTIIGVNPAEFNGAQAVVQPEIFLPLKLIAKVNPDPELSLLEAPDYWWVLMMGRIKPGISSQAAAQLAEAEFRNSLRTVLPGKKPAEFPGLYLQRGDRGDDMAMQGPNPSHLLFSVTALVLLIACVNLANLLSARGAARTREMSIRRALGAGRFRIVRQTLTESMLLAALGGVAGVSLGYASLRYLVSLIDETQIETHFDSRVFSFALGITLLAGLLFGMAPALRVSSLRAATSRALFGKTLVVVQVALSVVLLVGAGLCVRTLTNLRSVSIGFNPQRVLLFQIDPPTTVYQGSQRLALFQQILERVSTLPGVQSASLSEQPLLGRSMDGDCVYAAGRPDIKQNEVNLHENKVGPGFFETMELPIVIGRSFNPRDNEVAPRVAIVNRKLAAKLFPNASALGQTLNFCGESSAHNVEIVGVAADAKYNQIDADPPPTLYLSFLQQNANYSYTFEIKTAASTASMARRFRSVVASIDRDLPLLNVRTQTHEIDLTLGGQTAFAYFTGGLGLLALLLAGIGIYGIIAYTVSRRTNEIGIRMALGAQAGNVLSMVLRQAWLLALVGIAIGVVVALGATRAVASQLYGIKPNDPATYLSAGLLLLLVALLAGMIPARRAAKIDPCEALRHE